MPVTIDPDFWSLWASDPMPASMPWKWHHQATDIDRGVLEDKAKPLRKLFTNRKFVIVRGTEPPSSGESPF
jgi:hypothetical protein